MLLLEKKYFAVEGKIPLIKFAGSQWQRVLKSDKMADAAILGKLKISGKFPNNATNNVKQISSNGVTSLRYIFSLENNIDNHFSGLFISNCIESSLSRIYFAI